MITVSVVNTWRFVVHYDAGGPQGTAGAADISLLTCQTVAMGE